MTRQLTTEEIQKLAATYDWAIRDAVTQDELEEIIQRNAASKDDAYDATHDFVDANHYICAAYEEVFGEEPSLDEQNMRDLAAAVDYAIKVFLVAK